MSIFQNDILGWIWGAFAVLWFVPAFFGKRTIQRQTSGSRVLQIILVAAAYVLTFKPDLGLAWLNLRLLPARASITTLGYGMLLSGMLFASWARIYLGGNWSSNVTLKQDHTLVRSGPYRIVRHPIYTGLLLALLGTAISVGQLRCFLGLLLPAIAWKLKSVTEEAFMLQQFGEQYTRYRTQVKALVPYLW